MKKLYVAALYADNEENKKIAAELEPSGFVNVTRWMSREPLAKPYSKDSVSESLQENLEDMRNADAYLILPKKLETARGCYVEFGYILAHVESHPEKPIYLVSSEDPAFHWFHPSVTIFPSVDALTAYLKD